MFYNYLLVEFCGCGVDCQVGTMLYNPLFPCVNSVPEVTKWVR